MKGIKKDEEGETVSTKTLAYRFPTQIKHNGEYYSAGSDCELDVKSEEFKLFKKKGFVVKK